MPFHVKNILADKLDIKAAGTVYSNMLCTEVQKIGNVTPLILEVWSTEDASGAGAATISLCTSSDKFASNDTTVLTLPALNAAALKKGKIFECALPADLKKDIRIKIVTATGFTNAKITAAIRSRE